jgi:hypothetical protein
MTDRKPSRTPKVTISVADDLLPEWQALRAWLADEGELSLSRYVVAAALLCKRLGISNPESAEFGDLLMEDLLNESTWEPPNLDTATHHNGRVTMDDAAASALDKLF